MLAELMQAGKRVTTGVRGGECYVEMEEQRHYFLDDYLDPKNPCRVYICNVRRKYCCTLSSYYRHIIIITSSQLLKKWKYMTLPALMNLVQALRTPSIYQEDAVTLVVSNRRVAYELAMTVSFHSGGN